MIRVQRHQAVLLSGNSNGTHFAATGTEGDQNFGDRLLERLPPGFRVLLLMP